jgi:hypothetical protein
VLQKEVPTIKPDVFSPRAQKVKVYSPGLRAPAVGSASSAARAVDLRCVRKWQVALSIRRPAFRLHSGLRASSWLVGGEALRQVQVLDYVQPQWHWV